MGSTILTIVTIVVATINFFNISSALDGGKEAGRVVLREGRRVVHPTTEFPYSAMLEHKGKFKCGAVIITLKAVLSAAHCVKGIPGKKFSVRAGTFTKLDKTASNYQIRKVLQKFIAPDYENHPFDNDIAVLKLVVGWIFNEHVKAAQLPQYVQGEPHKNKNFLALGYGRNEYGEDSQTLKKSIFEVLPRNRCLQLDRKVPQNVLCILGPGGMSGAHFGDSGSPLIANHNPRSPYNDIVIGITAFVFDAQDQKGYSAYTNVMNFLSWIKSKL